ncbi:hypothetical protein CORC01_08753 [Colletotrichum orchidophilum]|uniref:Secreted protein n=1 Tax=Colletotrichum orchidophilum TaxID=1209926 RepID=A0A1G4B3C2_9PEZI|nr:uncharacterized protein CORC01_08753 [Colletotrichum orchidophilum]OHE95901.1 hypothetical protein CORC01_08753 [Colletotrichum orchidophilum]
MRLGGGRRDGRRSCFHLTLLAQWCSLHADLLLLRMPSCCFQVATWIRTVCVQLCVPQSPQAISEALRLVAPLPTSSSTSYSKPGDTAYTASTQING